MIGSQWMIECYRIRGCVVGVFALSLCLGDEGSDAIAVREYLMKDKQCEV